MRLATINSIILALAAASPALAVDWIFAPSTYTHDPQTAQRVSQYATNAPAYSYTSPDYRRSGYRHNTSINRVGPSADRIHIVEEWGRHVRPYGEWLRPYRPYSVPYDQWGPPFGGLGPGSRVHFGPGFPVPWLGPYAQPPVPVPYGGDIQFPPLGNRRFDNDALDRDVGEGETPAASSDLYPNYGQPGPYDRDASRDGAFGPIDQGAT